VFFSEDQGKHRSRPCSLDLRLVVRMRDVELLDKSHQESLYLDHAIQKPVFRVSGRADDV